MMYYSKSTGGFYTTAIHSVIPDDAISISDEYYAELFRLQSTGHSIVVDQTTNKPVAIENKPSYEALLAIASNNRLNAYITEADPLFFKAQRGEVSIDKWLEKINEIKERFPKPNVE